MFRSCITSRPHFCYSTKNVQSSGGVNWARLFSWGCNLTFPGLEAAELADYSSTLCPLTFFTQLSQDWYFCHSCCTWETLISSKIYVTLWLQLKSPYGWMDSKSGNSFTAFWIVFWTGRPSSHKRRFCCSRTTRILTERSTKRATRWPELCPNMPSLRRATRSPFCSATSRSLCGCGSRWPSWDARLLYWTSTSGPNLCCTAFPVVMPKSWLSVPVSLANIYCITAALEIWSYCDFNQGLGSLNSLSAENNNTYKLLWLTIKQQLHKIFRKILVLTELLPECAQINWGSCLYTCNLTFPIYKT